MAVKLGKYYTTIKGDVIGPLTSTTNGEYTDGVGAWRKDGTPTGPITLNKYGRLIKEWRKSPVTSVTRREIVEGTYGIIEIKKDSFGVFEYDMKSRATTEELREAAHTLNQIAEVLEENRK